MKPCNYSCQTLDHIVSRRRFFQTLAAGGAAAVLPNFGLFTSPVVAAEMARAQKRMIVINLAGGLSQLESWDPKPGTPTGGPFRAIPTSVPGIHISELLPRTAKRMHHMAVVRSVDNSTMGPDHAGTGMHIGRKTDPTVPYPTLAETV